MPIGSRCSCSGCGSVRRESDRAAMRLRTSSEEGPTSPRRWPGAVLILAVALGAILTAVTGAHSIEQAPGMPRGCRAGDPLAGVHHPARLQTIKPCIEVTGTVA